MQRHDQEKAVADFILHNQFNIASSVGPFDGNLSLQDNRWLLTLKEHVGGMVDGEALFIAFFMRLLLGQSACPDTYCESSA